MIRPAFTDGGDPAFKSREYFRSPDSGVVSSRGRLIRLDFHADRFRGAQRPSRTIGSFQRMCAFFCLHDIVGDGITLNPVCASPHTVRQSIRFIGCFRCRNPDIGLCPTPPTSVPRVGTQGFDGRRTGVCSAPPAQGAPLHPCCEGKRRAMPRGHGLRKFPQHGQRSFQNREQAEKATRRNLTAWFFHGPLRARAPFAACLRDCPPDQGL